jgi:chaperonin GroES
MAITTETGVRVADDDRAVAGDGARRFEQVTVQQLTVGGRELHVFHAADGTLQAMRTADDKLPIKMLNDRLLVRVSKEDGERRSSGGIVIPATAQMAKRLVWAEVVALGQNVRAAEVGDQVLFSAEDRYEVEVQGQDYIMLRERDIHAVAAERIEASTGLYL